MEPIRLQKTLTEIVDELETQQYEENVVGKKNSSQQTKVIEYVILREDRSDVQPGAENSSFSQNAKQASAMLSPMELC